jgi:glycine cleavage system H protein
MGANVYYFTKEHEWVTISGKTARVGITAYAAGKLGDVTYVQLPEPGKEVKQFDLLTGIESVKAASDVFSPVSGRVTAANAMLENMPELINKESLTGGWIAEIEVSDPSEIKNLMDAADYGQYTEGLEK